MKKILIAAVVNFLVLYIIFLAVSALNGDTVFYSPFSFASGTLFAAVWGWGIRGVMSLILIIIASTFLIYQLIHRIYWKKRK